MRYQIELAHSEPIHTAVIRGRVPPQELAQFVPAACGEVWSFVRSVNLPRPGRHFALYLDEQRAFQRVEGSEHRGDAADDDFENPSPEHP